MVIPSKDFSAIHKNLKNLICEFLDFKDCENIEVEARLGRINSKLTYERIRLFSSHPIIFEKLPYEWEFNATVLESDYNKIKQEFERYSKQPASSSENKKLDYVCESDDNPTMGLFNEKSVENTDSLIRNMMDVDSNTDEYGIFDRVASNDCVMLSDSVRKIDEGNKTRYEKKVIIKMITIYLPLSDYDIRISIAREIPVEPPKLFKTRMIRRREKHSFTFKEFVFDFKVVKSANITYEIELEVLNQNYQKDEFIRLMFGLLAKDK